MKLEEGINDSQLMERTYNPKAANYLVEDYSNYDDSEQNNEDEEN